MLTCWHILIASALLFSGTISATVPESPQNTVSNVPTVYVVQVIAPSENALIALMEEGFNVGNVSGTTATMYLREDEYARVLAVGYPTLLIETQPNPQSQEKADAYTTPDEIEAILAAYALQFPDLCRVVSLGDTVNKRDIWAIKITPNPDTPADKPVVKYIATIHGDEPVGTELCLYFADELLTTYGTDPYITDFLDRTVIWLVPMMNPDGFVLGARANANGFDLNRSFPIYGTDYTATWFDGAPLGDDGRQPEDVHIMRWNATTHATLAANFHTGALVANYPYDNEPGIPSGTPAPSPDELLFRFISLEYSTHNLPMYNSPTFPQGIVNGSDWYSITGGMMDWHYRFLGCPEVTIELSNVKKPVPSLLPQYWAENRDSMFAYAETAHIGIRGLTRDRNTNEPVWTKVLLTGNAQPVFSNADFGNYHRMALPGTYNVSFHADGYISYYVSAVMVNAGPATRVDVPLSDGDINADGMVNSTDVQLAVDAVLGRTIPYNADVNGRGLSATDIQAVINKAQS